MTATNKLLPCPFCGGKAEFRSGSSTTPYIRCKECGGRTKSSYDKAKLVAAWNRRLDATLGRGTCEVECFDDGMDEGMDGEWFAYATATWHLSCGHEVYGSERPSYCSTCGKRVVEP